MADSQEMIFKDCEMIHSSLTVRSLDDFLSTYISKWFFYNSNVIAGKILNVLQDVLSLFFGGMIPILYPVHLLILYLL